MDNCISVQICDDQVLVRAGLRRLLDGEPGLEVTSESATTGEAVAQVREQPPDVLVLDLGMLGRNGLDALGEIAGAVPETRVLVLSQHDDPAYVRRAFSAGATGYLLMEAADTELVHAIREVANAHPYLHPELGARLAAADADPLSEREHEVLHLLALGYTNQEIAKLLFMSVRTAETHRGRIMQKLGLHTRVEIVRYALTAGELDGERPPIPVHSDADRPQPCDGPSAPARLAQDGRGQRDGTSHLAPIRRLADKRVSGERFA